MGATAKAIAAWNALWDAAAGDQETFTRTLQAFLDLCNASGNQEALLTAKVIRFRLILTKGRPPTRWQLP